ncbi:MAG: hypothetical protein GY760_23080 [Deltaproteobacteria bacterium]|nr:hypothetical protein [Deltaproteobacteria bacterium]
MLKKFFLVLSLLFTIYSISARELQIDYLDGYLEVKNGSNWDSIDIGDVVSDSATLRLSDDGYAELTSGRTKISLIKDGIYETGNLLSHTTTASIWDLKRESLTKLFNNDERDNQNLSVMGVRGDPQDEEEISWVDDDMEFLEEGKSLYLQGEFHDALEILEEGIEWEGSNYEEILFYKVLCEYETGNYKQMRNSLFDMDPDPVNNFFGDYVVFKGNILIESQNYKEAEELFDRYISDSEIMDNEQLVYLLSAFCSIEMSNEENAESKLQKVIEINSSNDIGKKASDILRDL